jgi:non-specific serine/threonine protein kinase
MQDATEALSDLCLRPHGNLYLETTGPPSPWPRPTDAVRVAAAFAESTAGGLLQLASLGSDAVLPVAAAWWREFVRHYLSALCHRPDSGPEGEWTAVPVPPAEDMGRWIDSAPPMRGGEYLAPELLENEWSALDAHVCGKVSRHPQGLGAWLQAVNPLWRMVGRVTFHLAENKKNPDFPFAFMASYATRISGESRVQHLPLGRAIEEYAGAKNKPVLINLLAPVERAATKSALMRELVDSHRVLKPQPWRAADAYRFLRDVTVFEESGVLVRLPDWWKNGRPPRPQVSVSIGSQASAGVGVDTLLDFSAALTLDGEDLTQEEWQALMRSTDGLALIRGKWVEVDPAKLQQALDHWKKVEKMARNDGLSFFEGMRLLAGFRANGISDPAGAAPPETAWSGVSAGPWLDEILAGMKDPAKVAAPAEIPGLHATLRPYQHTGVAWLRFLSRLGLGACLADDMGLGKTLQVIATLLLRKNERPAPNPPSLLVVPASLLANWRAEIHRFAPGLRFTIIHPSEPGNRQSAADDLVITTYGMLTRNDDFRKRPWDVVILDEAQAIKNPATRQTRAVKEVNSQVRFALTGTPVENRASDLWSIFDFINPGLLGSAKAFGDFIKARDKDVQPDYGPLRALTKPYILRRLKTDKRVISDLPDKTEMRAFCPLTKMQAALYQKSVGELAEALENSDGIQRRGLVLAFIMRFKQICNHPSQWLADGAWSPEASGKFARLGEITAEIADRQEKALVFTQFREVTAPLAAFLTGVFRRPGLVLHGGTAVAKRRELVESFQRDDGPPFFILTVKAGGAGLNLTQAAHVIHFDRWWNPAVENQATDRAFRIGQKNKVLVHKFVCRGTIEERIDEVIESKRALSDELLEGGGEKMLTEMSNDELLRFVALDIHRATAS